MLTSQAVTGASGIPIGYATLLVVYLGVACTVVWLLRRLARAPLELPETSPSGEPAIG
jgi:cytochrome d ubiquinol oxidase subunit I